MVIKTNNGAYSYCCVKQLFLKGWKIYTFDLNYTERKFLEL